ERLPAWLSEGIASFVEAYPKPDYASALASAARSGALIRFSELCASFPSDAGRAYLAYAQSQSFTRYLRDTYGSTGLAGLIRAYSDGLDCELGAARALGVPLSQLDTRWREATLGENAAGAALRNLAPYLIMMGLALAIPAWGLARMAGEKRKHARGLT
ncbi:MAG: peptidase MA family metallohydrolase, partial [Bacteroidota bacterium]